MILMSLIASSIERSSAAETAVVMPNALSSGGILRDFGIVAMAFMIIERYKYQSCVLAVQVCKRIQEDGKLK